MKIKLGNMEVSANGCESRLERLEIKEMNYWYYDPHEVFSPYYYREGLYPEGEYAVEEVVYEEREGNPYIKLWKQSVDEKNEDRYFLIPLGCHKNGKIGNDTLEISGNDYDNLLKTTYEDKYTYNIRAKARITFSENENKNDKCYSPIIKAEFPYTSYYRRGDETGDILSERFKDIDKNYKHAHVVAQMVSNGLIDGYPDDTFRPDSPINRAEIAKMIVNSNHIFLGNEAADMSNTNCFSDIHDEWFAPYVCYAKDKGWIKGYEDGTYRPEQKVTRAEAIKMVLASIYTGPSSMMKHIDKPTIQKFYNEFFKEWYEGDYEEIFLNDSNLPIFYESDEGDCEKGCLSYRKMPQDYEENTWYAPYLEYAIRHGIVDTNHIENLDNPGREIYRLPEKYNYFPGDNMSRIEVAELVFNAPEGYVQSAEKILKSMQMYLAPSFLENYTAFVTYTGCYVEGFGKEEIIDFFQEVDDYYQSSPLYQRAPRIDFKVSEGAKDFFGEIPVPVDDFLEKIKEEQNHLLERMSEDATEEELKLFNARYENNPINRKIKKARDTGTLVCK
jgi:hypothetical protein